LAHPAELHVAGLSASSFALLAAVAVPIGSRGGGDDDGGAAVAALGRHAALAFGVTAAALLLCCGAHTALQRVPSLQECADEAPASAPLPPPLPARHRRREADSFAEDASAPLLTADAEEARSESDGAASGDDTRSSDGDAQASTAALHEQEEGASPSEGWRHELRLYKLVRAACLLRYASDTRSEALDAKHRLTRRVSVTPALVATQCVFCIYVVSLCAYPDITAWLRPARSRDGSGSDATGLLAQADAVFPFGLRLRGDLLVPLTFVIFNAVRGSEAGRACTT
jgi:hypothetical protein